MTPFRKVRKALWSLTFLISFPLNHLTGHVSEIFDELATGLRENRELKQRRRQRQRKRQLKKELRVTSTTSRLFQFVQLVQCRRSIQELDCWE